MPQNWNIPGIGGDLPQIANMLYQRQNDQQRNALAQLAQEQEAKRYSEQMGFQQSQLQQQAADRAAQLQWRQEDSAASRQARAEEQAANRQERIERAKAEAQLRRELAAQRAAGGGSGGGQPAGAKTNPLGFNERQMAGVGMQQDAIITYAAQLTNKTPDKIRELLRTGGPDAVAEEVAAKGKRTLQGGFAKFLSEAPVIGGLMKPAIEAANADLTAPITQGGAGIALQQNPTGMITTPDFQAVEKQMPTYAYPLGVQAQMIRDALAKGQQAGPMAGASGPAVGSVEDGYRFKGGNPGNPNSWEPVK